MCASVLKFENIVKTYSHVAALKNVSLDIKEGEIHALVGENGAGKSTLIKCCTGAVIPDSGTISIGNSVYRSMTPKRAVEYGIAVIYQEFNLVRELSVAENIFLGRAPKKGIVIDRNAMNEETIGIFKELELNIDPDVLVKDLTIGYQQLVEIAKALSQKTKLLIMDEPTAPLTKKEAAVLFKIIKKLQGNGLTVIYISHRMEEIFELSDRITVMRDGEKIRTLKTEETKLDELLQLMVGRPFTDQFPKRETVIGTECVLEAKNLTGNGVKNISFKIRKGEILGFAGLIGSGRTETAQLLFGVKKIKSGEIMLYSRTFVPKNPHVAMDAGLAYVPEDRKHQGALLSMDIKNNITLAILRRISICSLIDRRKDKTIAEHFVHNLNIKTPGIMEYVKNLSGGNQQKVILAKWLASNPELIILDEPTRGIDIGAKHEIYKLMNKLVSEGKTILMISSEMEELIGMADRIAVFSEGSITGFIDKKDVSQKLIMKYASMKVDNIGHL